LLRGPLVLTLAFSIPPVIPVIARFLSESTVAIVLVDELTKHPAENRQVLKMGPQHSIFSEVTSMSGT
jgi:hypothetical protein